MYGLLNLLWFIFHGWALFAIWATASVLLTITIIGIPHAIAAWRIAIFAALPFDKELVPAHLVGEEAIDGSGFANCVWFILAGLWLGVSHILLGIASCLTIIGIPFGVAHFKIAIAAFMPLGKRTVPLEIARPAKKKWFLMNNIRNSHDYARFRHEYLEKSNHCFDGKEVESALNDLFSYWNIEKADIHNPEIRDAYMVRIDWKRELHIYKPNINALFRDILFLVFKFNDSRSTGDAFEDIQGIITSARSFSDEFLNPKFKKKAFINIIIIHEGCFSYDHIGGVIERLTFKNYVGSITLINENDRFVEQVRSKLFKIPHQLLYKTDQQSFEKIRLILHDLFLLDSQSMKDPAMDNSVEKDKNMVREDDLNFENS